MGKVRDYLVESGSSPCSELPGSYEMWLAIKGLEREDSAAHAAELGVADARIAELESQLKCATGQASFAGDKCMEHVKRIAGLDAELYKLSYFILTNVPGEPSQNEGAVDAAVRIICSHQARIAELEASRKEPPPLPESVTHWVNSFRDHKVEARWLVEFTAWIDAHYPRPVPQWELDADLLERSAKNDFAIAPEIRRDIAARIREAHNAK